MKKMSNNPTNKNRILKKGEQIMNKKVFTKVICLLIAMFMLIPSMPNALVNAEVDKDDKVDKKAESIDTPLATPTTGSAVGSDNNSNQQVKVKVTIPGLSDADWEVTIEHSSGAEETLYNGPGEGYESWSGAPSGGTFTVTIEVDGYYFTGEAIAAYQNGDEIAEKQITQNVNTYSFSFDAATDKSPTILINFNLNLYVPPTNNAPVAVNDTATTQKNTSVEITALSNDSDQDGDTITITSVGTASNGTVVIIENGTKISYTPDENYTGTDSFTYTISDGNGGTDTASVNVRVTDPLVNQVPEAVDDTATTQKNTSVDIDVLSNDSDLDGDTLTITLVGTAGHGTVAIIEDGTKVTYTPDNDYIGTDSFTYTISDGNGGTDSATVNVTVTDPLVNKMPDAVDDTATTQKNTSVDIIVLSNDSDPDGDTITITSVGTAGHGTVAIIEDGTKVTYTPDNDYIGTDSFTYTISDGNGGTDTATVNVIVTDPGTPVNQAPIAGDDTATTKENTSVNINVLLNDSDPDDDDITITSVGNAGHGTVIIENGTKVTYTPDEDYIGDDSFTYTISDGNGGTDTAIVTISVDENDEDDEDKDDEDEDDEDKDEDEDEDEDEDDEDDEDDEIVSINNPDVPLGNDPIEPLDSEVTPEEELIADQEVPQATTLPDTGSFLNTTILSIIGSILILAGIVLNKKKSLIG